MLTLVLYGLFGGVFTPAAPRTLPEAQLNLLRNAVQKTPGSADAWVDYVKVLTTNSQFREAHDVLAKGRSAAESSSTAALFSLAAGRLAYSEGDAATTIKMGTQAAGQDEAAKMARAKELAVGGILVPKNQWPNDIYISAQLLIAHVFVDQSRWQEAVAPLSAVLDRDPGQAAVLVARGEAYVQLKQDDKARADFETALKYVPGYARAKKDLDSLTGTKGVK
jgi:tetratricopeptide (TPR) repeat protein